MNVPPRVGSVLGEEDVAAHVPLKGEDALFVTPTRTLHYTSEGLLSDESVTEYDHAAERVEVREGRRKAKIVLDYGLEGDAEIPVPGGSVNDALHPILAGVLNASGVTEAGETVKRTYRFSELTLVVTSHRVVKHIGNAVWDDEFEQVPFADVTGLGVEEGNVASQLVLETTGRTQRIKAPNEEFRDVRETLEDALFAFHDVADAAEFQAAVAPVESTPESTGSSEVSFDAEPELDVDSGTEQATADPTTGTTQAEHGGAGTGGGHAESTDRDSLAESGFEKASSKVQRVDAAAVRGELDAIEDELDEQSAAIEAQRERVDAIRDLLPEE